jgi:hypothetical protein
MGTVQMRIATAKREFTGKGAAMLPTRCALEGSLRALYPDTSAIMEPIAHGLTEPQITAVAAYLNYLE